MASTKEYSSEGSTSGLDNGPATGTSSLDECQKAALEAIDDTVDYSVHNQVPHSVALEMKEHSTHGSTSGPDHVFDNGTFSLDECRKAALAEIDHAKFSWFHLRVCLVAGVGFFADAYNIFVINLASSMYTYLPESSDQLLSSSLGGFCLKVAAPVGTFFGQLIFGWLADCVGRKKMYGIEMVIVIVGTFGQALAGATQTVSLFGTLIVWRFIMGVGAGGDYPLSAIIVAEFSPIKFRGRLMTAVFACQGWGNFAAALVSLVLVSAFKVELQVTNKDSGPDQASAAVDQIWRLLIGLGCIPAVIGLFFRLTVPETPRFTVDIDRNLDRAHADIETSLGGGGNYDAEFIRRVVVPKASWQDFIAYFSRWANLKILIATAYSWFAIDFAFYGLGLNTNPRVKGLIFPSPSDATIYQTLYSASTYSLFIAAAGLIPGYWATFFLIDRWGRKPIQLMGFSVLSILFIVTGATFDRLTSFTSGERAATFLYCFGNFFQNFGPNTTTFIIPGELFPTRYRSTCHGIAAAVGKIGAIISLLVFYEINTPDIFFGHILLIMGFVMMTGIGSTLWIPETSGKSLEDLSNERQQGFVRGYAHHSAPTRQRHT